MRQRLSRKFLIRLVALVISISTLGNGLIASGQPLADDFVPVAHDLKPRDEALARYLRKVRGADFENLLMKSIDGKELATLLDAFDSDNAKLFRAIEKGYRSAATEYFAKPVEGGTTPSVKPAVRTRARGAFLGPATFDRAEKILFTNARYSPDDELAVTKTETENGVEIKGATEKTVTVGDVVITKGSSGGATVSMSERGMVGEEYKILEFTEAVNAKERSKLKTETSFGWKIAIPMCPDANGIVLGKATMFTNFKMTITIPRTIGILTREATTTVTIKGHVNDAASLTHFNTEASATQVVAGYDRAERLDLAKNSEYVDGTTVLEYTTTDGSIGREERNEYGTVRTVGETPGTSRGVIKASRSVDDAKKFDELAGFHVAYVINQASTLLAVAQKKWRNDVCVEIKFAAPKTTLAPGEVVAVSTETVHKLDNSKVNADLEVKTATQSASPEKQRGESQATFKLTAPPKGSTGYLYVESVSRRGIATESLEFQEEKPTKKPLQTKKAPPEKKCTGAWSGKITAVKTKRIETTKPASGRFVRGVETKDETFSIDYEVLGIPDTSEGFTNAFIADAHLNFRELEYRESNYAPGKMSCNHAIITTPQTQKFESLTTGLSRKRLTVFITSTGSQGVLTFGSPPVSADRIVTRTYESSCPSYNQVNSGVERSDSPIEIAVPSFEIYFELGPRSASVLEGSKTIENSDGSRTTVTWNLIRNCE